MIMLLSVGGSLPGLADHPADPATSSRATGNRTQAVKGPAKRALPAPPVAPKRPKRLTAHGDTRVDDYYWLREKDSPDVLAYLKAENAYADAFMKPAEELQEKLYQELLARIKQTDLSVPYRKGGYFYYSRTEDGKQYRIYCRKAGSPDAAEEIILDVNALAEGERFMRLGEFQVSDDGNLLAYSTDNTGFREYTLHVRNLGTGEIGPERIGKVKSVAWAADNRTLFYTVDDDAKRPYRLYRHRLGASDDDLVYEEKDERFRIFVGRSRSMKYILLESASLTTSEFRHLPAGTPEGKFTLIAPREQEHEYQVDHGGDLFYIRTNDRGRNFRVVTAPVASPGRENWKEIIPHSDEIMRSGLQVFAGHYVVRERERSLPQLRVTDARTGESHRIGFPEPVYTLFPSDNEEFDTASYRFNYQSLTTSKSIFDYDVKSRERTLLKQEEVLGGYDPDDFESERTYAIASDGVRIPVSIVHRKGLERNGKNPTLLKAYGSYGYPYAAEFDHDRVSLLDRGFVVALAHIRGGGEMGKKWHDGGRMFTKKNTFTDFIAAAEMLIAEKYTSRDRLAIQGGSAGGLLMGAVSNMRPDLFKVVLNHVPFVDVLTTMLDEDIPLTVGEFEEWGNPEIKEQYDYMKTYCPYTNIAARDYPTILVKTSYDDSQVMYWEPAKYVAKLRALKTDDNPLLFKINMAGGHGGSSGRYDKLREIAFDYAFLLTQFGVEPR
jgi:oligopeptidase B